MDLESSFRNRIEQMLITASWCEEVRLTLGITGVSQVWEDTPAWYFWLEGMPGAYEFGLREAWSKGGDERALFAVRFFPRPEEARELGVSADERALLGEDVFDTTTTPHGDGRARIGPQRFQVALVEVVFSGSGAAVFRLETAERLRVRAGDAGDVSGSVFVRDVPGWDLGLPHPEAQKILADAGGYSNHGNDRTAWKAGCRFDFENPEHRA